MLGKAAAKCGEVQARAKVRKASLYLSYLRVLRGAVNCHHAATGAGKEDVRAGLSVRGGGGA